MISIDQEINEVLTYVIHLTFISRTIFSSALFLHISGDQEFQFHQVNLHHFRAFSHPINFNLIVELLSICTDNEFGVVMLN